MSKDQTTWNEHINTIISHLRADEQTDVLLQDHGGCVQLIRK